MACTGPVTALICLQGWNRIEAWLSGGTDHSDTGVPPVRAATDSVDFDSQIPDSKTPSTGGTPVSPSSLEHRRGRLRLACGIVGALLCTGWTIGQYILEPSHYDCFPIIRCVRQRSASGTRGPLSFIWYGTRVT